MKYPKDSYIVRNAEKKKVLEVLGDIRFLSQSETWSHFWNTEAKAYYHISELERDGWKVENEKWKPKYDEWYWYIDRHCNLEDRQWKNDDIDNELYSLGNCFPSNNCPEILEAQRKIKEVFKK